MGAAHLVELLEIPGQDPFVVLLLQGGHGHPQDAFILGRQALLHILDHAPKQLWAEQGMQVANLQSKSPQDLERLDKCRQHSEAMPWFPIVLRSCQS